MGCEGKTKINSEDAVVGEEEEEEEEAQLKVAETNNSTGAAGRPFFGVWTEWILSQINRDGALELVLRIHGYTDD